MGTPLLSFVVPCKGRLTNLRRTLPILARFRESECVVVDYDCPQQSGRWAKARFPNVNVVFVPPGVPWQLAKARNIGARAASAPFLCFLDSDYLVTPDFFAALAPHLSDDRFIITANREDGTAGFLVCPRSRFLEVMYDEHFDGYGREDSDITLAMHASGLQGVRLRNSFVFHIPHDAVLRTKFYVVKDADESLGLMSAHLFRKWGLSIPEIKSRFASYPVLPIVPKSNFGHRMKILWLRLVVRAEEWLRRFRARSATCDARARHAA